MDCIRLYTLGDSNGALNPGWPEAMAAELSGLLAGRSVWLRNDSLPGRAIGFAKFGPESSALTIAAPSVAAATHAIGGLDLVAVCLGTNDVQNLWVQRGHTLSEIAANFERLLDLLSAGTPDAKLLVVTPPAMGWALYADAPDQPGKIGEEQVKRRGGAERLSELVEHMRRIACERQLPLADLHAAMLDRTDDCLGPDCVHLNSAGVEFAGRVAAAAAARVLA